MKYKSSFSQKLFIKKKINMTIIQRKKKFQIFKIIETIFQLFFFQIKKFNKYHFKLKELKINIMINREKKFKKFN